MGEGRKEGPGGTTLLLSSHSVSLEKPCLTRQPRCVCFGEAVANMVT